jgi:hypothetical protein
LIWSEVKQLWDVGLEEYANDMWNVIDFVTNSLYVATVALRVVAYNQVRHKHCTALKVVAYNQVRHKHCTARPTELKFVLIAKEIQHALLPLNRSALPF